MGGGCGIRDKEITLGFRGSITGRFLIYGKNGNENIITLPPVKLAEFEAKRRVVAVPAEATDAMNW